MSFSQHFLAFIVRTQNIVTILRTGGGQHSDYNSKISMSLLIWAEF